MLPSLTDFNPAWGVGQGIEVALVGGVALEDAPDMELQKREEPDYPQASVSTWAYAISLLSMVALLVLVHRGLYTYAAVCALVFVCYSLVALLLGFLSGFSPPAPKRPATTATPATVPTHLEVSDALHDLSGVHVPELQPQSLSREDLELLRRIDQESAPCFAGGASQSQIDTLPTCMAGEGVAPLGCETCPVCLEATELAGAQLRVLPCAHRFHRECIDPWLRAKASCPLCQVAVCQGQSRRQHRGRAFFPGM